MPSLKRAPRAGRPRTMAVGFLVDGEGPFSLDEMARDNQDDPELVERLRQMKPGDVLHEGGGAWAEVNITAVAMAAARRARRFARPGELQPGERVRNMHGELGTVVGPGAAGERVIIQWDDGSSSNLSAVDLERWGVEPASTLQHRATMAGGDTWPEFCDRLRWSIDLIREAKGRANRVATLQEWSRRIGERLRLEQGGSTSFARIGHTVSCPVCGEMVEVIGVTVPGRGDEPGSGPFPHLARHDNPSTSERCEGTLRDASTLARAALARGALSGTSVSLDGYYWVVIAGDREDAYAFRDGDPTDRVPERLAAILRRDGWPEPYTLSAARSDMSRRARWQRTMASASGLKSGDRIELVAMPDDPNPVPVGTRGTVEWANDVDFGGGDRFTQVSVRWDNGRSLMLSIPPDRVRKV